METNTTTGTENKSEILETAESQAAPEQKEISFEDFEKLDLRIGKIIEVTPIPNSKKLMKVMVDFGSEKRQAVAGLLQYYKPHWKEMCFSAQPEKTHASRSRITMYDTSCRRCRGKNCGAST